MSDLLRDRIIPTAWLVLALFIPAFGVATARADTPSPQVIAYATEYHAAVCDTLNDYPSATGVAGVVLAITGDGWTGAEAGQIIATSVLGRCPQHTGAVQAFIRRYSHADQITA